MLTGNSSMEARSVRMKNSYNEESINSKRILSLSVLKGLVASYGSPIFIAFEDVFRRNCKRFLHDFKCGQRRVVCAYSYKTNNVKALCQMAHEEGLAAEVVSAAELSMALSLGVDGRQIYYNGPLKPVDSIMMAIKSGAALHVDSLTELNCIGSIAAALGLQARIGLRITPRTGNISGPIWNKFGISSEEGELSLALDQISRASLLKLEGLHLHIGTNLTDPALYEQAMSEMVAVGATIRRSLGQKIAYVDIGGGFAAASGAIPIAMHPEEWSPPSISEIGSRLSGILDHVDEEEDLVVVTEPGRVIAESCMALLTSVVSVKNRQGRKLIILDAGTNLLPSSYYTRHPLSFPGKENEGADLGTDFHGPLCTQYDMIASEVEAPSLDPEDIVVVYGAGAYTCTFSCQFTGPRPPIVLIGTGGSVDLIREIEPDDILWRYDKFPKR